MGEVAHAQVLKASAYVRDVLAGLQQALVSRVLHPCERTIFILIHETRLGAEGIVKVDPGPNAADQQTSDEPADTNAALQWNLLVSFL